MMKIQCFNCSKIVDRLPSQARRSKRHYCSRSCAIKINNSLTPKRKKKSKEVVVVHCVICKSHVPNVTRAKKYCIKCARQKNIDRTTQYRRDLKKKAVKYLGGQCSECGYCKSLHAMDFHHKVPEEKDFAISAYSNLCWSRIVKELDKCILLCANCHRELHDLA